MTLKSDERIRTVTLRAPGSMSIDYETRVDFDRLREYRLSRVRKVLEGTDLGGLLLFDNNNIRYLTATKIGEWTRDKFARFALITRTGEPILWDFGSAAKSHRMFSPWLLPENSRAGLTGLRGAVPPEVGLFDNAAKEIASLLREQAVKDMPLGMDVAELPMLAAVKEQGIDVQDGQQAMLEARRLKSQDEITLLSQAASMVDGVYQMIYDEMKPGLRENEIVAKANDMLYRMGSEDVEAINAVSGERTNPHPHDFSDRLLRPGDQVFFDIMHSYNGYRTCYYRTLNVGRATEAQRDAYKRCREWLDAAIDMVKPGVTTADIAEVWPTAEEIGFDNEMDAFALQFGHGLGLNLHERPIISRLNSLSHPEPIEEGMVFALETWAPARDGRSAARIEEEVVVTADGCEVITLFPAEDLLIANEYSESP